MARPGITGLAQVNGNTSVSWDERILYDIAYVRGCSLAVDLGILLRTLASLAVGEAAMTRPFEQTCYARYVTRPVGYGS